MTEGIISCVATVALGSAESQAGSPADKNWRWPACSTTACQLPSAAAPQKACMSQCLHQFAISSDAQCCACSYIHFGHTKHACDVLGFTLLVHKRFACPLRWNLRLGDFAGGISDGGRPSQGRAACLVVGALWVALAGAARAQHAKGPPCRPQRPDRARVPWPLRRLPCTRRCRIAGQTVENRRCCFHT